MAKKRKSTVKVEPDFMEKQRQELAHTCRQVFYLNKKELAAIDEYCRQFKISSRSAMYRQAIMERILKDLGENHPTLF